MHWTHHGGAHVAADDCKKHKYMRKHARKGGYSLHQIKCSHCRLLYSRPAQQLVAWACMTTEYLNAPFAAGQAAPGESD
jgi:hypothetical protein